MLPTLEGGLSTLFTEAALQSRANQMGNRSGAISKGRSRRIQVADLGEDKKLVIDATDKIATPLQTRHKVLGVFADYCSAPCSNQTDRSSPLPDEHSPETIVDDSVLSWPT